MKGLNTIGISKVRNDIGSAGVGYVVIPEGIDDLKTYIEDCYRTNTLTIWGGRGYGYFSHIHVDQDVMQNIQFPENTEENNRGSAVVWVKDDNSQVPIIIASIRKQNDFYMLEPNQYRLSRSNGNRTTELFLDANNSEVTINVLGDSEEPANMKIKVISENKDSKFSIYSDNSVKVDAKQVSIASIDNVNVSVEKDGTTQTKITCKVDEGKSSVIQKKIDLLVTDEDGEEQMHASYETGNGFSYKDEFDNEVVCKDGEIDLTSKKIVEKADTINHNGGSEPMVLGNTLKDLLDQLCSQVSDICIAASTLMVTCGMPGSPSSPPANAAKFIAAQSQVNVIKGRLQQILSQKSNLD